MVYKEKSVGFPNIYVSRFVVESRSLLCYEYHGEGNARCVVVLISDLLIMMMMMME